MASALIRAELATLACAQVAYAYVPAARRPAATRAIVALTLASSATDAAQARGLRRGLALLGVAGATGLIAEHIGTATGRPFGSYGYSGLLGPRVRGVPVLAGGAWAMMARPAWTVAGLIAARPVARAVLAAGSLTAWDVFLDPRMVREGYWRWATPGRYEGIPASNFAGWLGTGLVAFALWALVDPDDDPQRRGGPAVALYVWTWAGETFANAVIWRRPRVAVAGALAMGAFALPALAAWGRAACIRRRRRPAVRWRPAR